MISPRDYLRLNPQIFSTSSLLITYLIFPSRDLGRLCLQNFPHLSTSEYLIFTPKHSFCPLQITSSFTLKIFSPVKYWLLLSPKHHLSFSSKISPYLSPCRWTQIFPQLCYELPPFCPHKCPLCPHRCPGDTGRSLCPQSLSAAPLQPEAAPLLPPSAFGEKFEYIPKCFYVSKDVSSSYLCNMSQVRVLCKKTPCFPIQTNFEVFKKIKILQGRTETLWTLFAVSLSLPGHQKEVLGQFLFHACQGPRDKKVNLLLSIIATGFEFTSGLHFYNILLI